jgi:hypothetical protein
MISKVNDHEIEIVQQNPGPNTSSRVTYPISYKNGLWKIENVRVLGYLRKANKPL